MTYVEKEIAAAKEAMKLFSKDDPFFHTLNDYLNTMIAKLPETHEQSSFI